MEPNRALERLYCTVVTPFHEDYTLDEAAFRHFLRHFLRPAFLEVGGLIINPEAGEIGLLSRDEKRRLVEIALEEAGGRLPVFAGVAGLRTEETVAVARDAKELGVTGLFLCPPMGSGDVTRSWLADKYPEVWIDQAHAQLAAADLPAIVHPTAGSTGWLPLDATLAMCRALPNIFAWKMTYPYEEYRRIATGLRTLDRRVAIFGASGHRFHEYLAVELFDGAATGALCYALEPMLEHVSAWRRQDLPRAQMLWRQLSPLHEYVYGDRRHHVRYKLATWLRGLIPNPWLRPPMPKPRREEVTVLHALLQAAGLAVIDQDAVDAVLTRLDR